MPTVQEAARPGGAPPPAWLQGDPADSLYRAAREALNRREYQRAADLLRPHSRAVPQVRVRARRALLAGVRPLPGRGRRRSSAPRGKCCGASASVPPTRPPRGTRRRSRCGSRVSLPGAGDQEAVKEVRRVTGDLAVPPRPPVPPEAARPPVPPDRMGGHEMHGGGRCEDEDDDMQVAALNALLQMDATRRCRSCGRCWPAGTPLRSASAARRSSWSPSTRARKPSRSCSPRRAPTPTARCGSRRCSGSPRWHRAAVAALDSILRTSTDRRCRTRRSSRCPSRTPRAPGRRCGTYALRADVSERSAREGDLLDRPGRRSRQREVPQTLYGQLRTRS